MIICFKVGRIGLLKSLSIQTEYVFGSKDLG